MGILCILVRENAQLRSEKKTVFYLTYILIALAALAEWLGLKLGGSTAPFGYWSHSMASAALLSARLS